MSDITRDEARKELLIIENVTNKEIRGSITTDEHNRRAIALQKMRNFINQQPSTTPQFYDKYRSEDDE